MSLLYELKAVVTKYKRIAFLGIGSELRCDDRAGMLFAEQIQKIAGKNILVLKGSTAPENFTGVIKDFAPDCVIAVDAAHMGLPVGSTAVLDSGAIANSAFSTHMLPLSMMFDYLKQETGCDIICIGIEPADTSQGFDMTEAVRDAAVQLAVIFIKLLSENE